MAENSGAEHHSSYYEITSQELPFRQAIQLFVDICSAMGSTPFRNIKDDSGGGSACSISFENIRQAIAFLWINNCRGITVYFNDTDFNESSRIAVIFYQQPIENEAVEVRLAGNLDDGFWRIAILGCPDEFPQALTDLLDEDAGADEPLFL